MNVTDLVFTKADRAHRETGLLGWIQVTLAGAVVIDGIALRRTLHGDLVLSWPRKPNGKPVATPANASARRRIENAIIDALVEEIGA